nr:Coenzyme F420 hydrogenase/dehydrogenase, beta subunit C-terminal domain [uncultured Cellulosilyticum sp.]
MEICNSVECTGCMACRNICPVDAIQVKADRYGFYIPVIAEDKCLKCGKCKKICPNNYLVEGESSNQIVLATWRKEKEIREKSTSGGIFTGVAEWIIQQDGVVFGAIMDKAHNVRHSLARTMAEVEAMRGSKYVQSDVGYSYRAVKKELETGRVVLYTGTPCQLAGLYRYLEKPYDNLYTMDIVCHGVPSPKVFKDYIQYIEESAHDEAIEISFRKKKPSWSVFSMYIKFQTGKEYIKDAYHDPYLVGFLDDYLSRECCYTCKYTRESRLGDITAADFWSYVSYTYKERNTEKGISLVILNTEKGKRIFEDLKDKYFFVERSIQEAKRGNRCLTKPYGKAKKREEFWKEYNESNDFIRCASKFFPKKKRSLKHRISEMINRYYYIMPNCVKKKLKAYWENKK